MIKRSTISTLIFAACLLFTHGCGKEETRQARGYSVEACKQLLSTRDYSSAIKHAEGVLASNPANSEARYCAVLANLGMAFQAWSTIFGLLSSQLSAPPSYSPDQSIDVKEKISGILNDIENAVGAADRHIFILAQEPDPQIYVDDYPVHIESIVLTFLLLADEHAKMATHVEDPNLRGRWDKSHLLLLGAFTNAVQSMRDYLFAHNLTVDLGKLPDMSANDTSMEIARFFVAYPRFLGFDEADAGRIAGNEVHDGLKRQVLAAVSYLAGRHDTLPRVAPQNEGLAHAIARSAASTTTDAPIRWIDDGDGVPEEVILSWLPALKITFNGKKIENPRIENPLGQELWKAAITLAGDIRNNLEEKDPKPVSLYPVLRAGMNKLAADPQNASVRLFRKELPNFLAVNPGAFFAEPVAIRDLLPFTFAFTSSGTTSYDMAVESEYFASATENSLEKLGKVAETGTDFSHFDYTGFPQTVSDYTVTGYEFFNGGLEPKWLAADGVTATAKSPLLYYLSFPHPGLGGLMVADANGFTATPTFDPPTNTNLNLALNRFISYYCLDLTVGIQESVDERSYDADNRIEDCLPWNLD